MVWLAEGPGFSLLGSPADRSQVTDNKCDEKPESAREGPVACLIQEMEASNVPSQLDGIASSGCFLTSSCFLSTLWFL